MQSQFVITECNLFTDRLGDEFVDLTQMIIELSFEESIYEMCIYGEISILDDKGFFDKLNFQGTERLEITIGKLSPPISNNSSDSLFSYLNGEKLILLGVLIFK